MNGFTNQGLDEGNFGASSGISVSAFDAFPKTKQTYITKTRSGGIWTIIFSLACLFLTGTELRRWNAGTTTHTFSVEKGIAHDLQINLDVVVAMKCPDLHVNVQDASGDRILAGDLLKKDPTRWDAWPMTGRKSDGSSAGGFAGANWMKEQAEQYTHEEDVHDYLGAAKGRRKFPRTPRLRREANACRIYGSIEGNKVQGDFHITARGHGYMEMGEHLDHKSFNFSHHITELSFGPYYPTLRNPLDATTTTTALHFYKYQYYLSVVPTIYTDAPASLQKALALPPSQRQQQQPDAHPRIFSPHTIFTNQYAATEQSHGVGESAVPGVFVKYDIEPILLTVAEEWGGLLGMLIRCVNVVAGVLVAGGWLVRLIDWAGEAAGRRGGRSGMGERSRSGAGHLLYGHADYRDEKDEGRL